MILRVVLLGILDSWAGFGLDLWVQGHAEAIVSVAGACCILILGLGLGAGSW